MQHWLVHVILISQNSIWLVTSWHDSTCLTCRGLAFGLCGACRTARLNMLVSTYSARRTCRVVETWRDEPSGIWAIFCKCSECETTLLSIPRGCLSSAFFCLACDLKQFIWCTWHNIFPISVLRMFTSLRWSAENRVLFITFPFRNVFHHNLCDFADVTKCQSVLLALFSL